MIRATNIKGLCLVLLMLLCSGLTGPVHAAVTPLDFAVNMNEATVVDTGGGTPRIAIDVGGVTP